MINHVWRKALSFALGVAGAALVTSSASAAIFSVDTSVAGGTVAIDGSVGSINAFLSTNGHVEDAAVGRILLHGLRSDTGTIGDFSVFCIDVEDRLVNADFVSQPLSYVTSPGAGGQVGYTATQLKNVLKYMVYAEGQGISGPTKSAAEQLGIWEIISEPTTSWNLNSGDFSVSSWYGSNIGDAATVANTWLGASRTQSTIGYSLGILDPGPNNQIQAYLRHAQMVPPGSQSGAVPEPASWGMMIVGFGAVGATMRRRRASLARA